MASFKAQRAAGPAPMRVDGDAVLHTDKIVLGASPGVGTPAATDTIDFLVPGGARLCDLTFIVDDLDTNGVPTIVFGVGYRPVNTGSSLAASATYFAAAGQTTGQAGGRLECAFKPIKFEEDVYIQLTIGTAAATLNPANPEIHMIAGYNCEGQR